MSQTPLLPSQAHFELSHNPSNLPMLPGWTAYTHPEGDTYYRNAQSHLIISIDPLAPSVMGIVTVAHTVFNEIHHLYLSGPPVTIELYVGLDGYYIVDHTQRCVLWSTPNLVSVPQSSFEYWTHVSRFPSHVQLPLSAESELLDALSYWCIDAMAVHHSAALYSAERGEEILARLSALHQAPWEGLSPERTLVFAKIWRDMSRHRAEAGGIFIRGEPILSVVQIPEPQPRRPSTVSFAYVHMRQLVRATSPAIVFVMLLANQEHIPKILSSLLITAFLYYMWIKA